MKASYILVFLLLLLIIGISFSTCVQNTSSSSDTINENSTSVNVEPSYDIYLKCESFIEEGVRYVFDKVADAQNTIPVTYKEYNHGEIVVNGNMLTTVIGANREDYRIVKAIFEEENEAVVDEYEDGQQDHRAQLVLKSNGKYYYARFELTNGVHKFILSKPIESPIELQYFPRKSFGFALNEYDNLEPKCTFYYFR